MPDPVGFDVSNPQTPDAGPIIYISDDAAKWGRLTITLTNQSTDNSDLELAPDGVLRIYLEMLTPDDIKSIKLADGSPWTGGPDNTNRHLELHPKQTIVIPSQTSVTIELRDVLGKTPRQGKFRFYDETLGIRNAVVQGFVQRPPGDAAKQWGLACVLDPRRDYQGQGNTVYVTAPGTDIENHLLVHIYRAAGGTLPSSGRPQLSFSFLTGDDDLALCSEDRLKKVTASIQDQRPQGRWKEPAADSQGDDTVWTVAPTDGGGDLFTEEGLLIVRFDSIVTDLPPGNSILFIHYSGLTGYDDGHIQVPLIKSDPIPYVRSFNAASGGQPVAIGAAVIYGPLALSWDVFAADAVVLHDDVTGAPIGGPFRPKDSTTVQAVAARPSFSLTPRLGGIDRAADAVEISFALALPTAKGDAFLMYDGVLQHLFWLELYWSTTGAATCRVSHPYFGQVSTALSGKWTSSQFGRWATGPRQKFTIEVTNPAGTVQVPSSDLQPP